MQSDIYPNFSNSSSSLQQGASVDNASTLPNKCVSSTLMRKENRIFFVALPIKIGAKKLCGKEGAFSKHQKDWYTTVASRSMFLSNSAQILQTEDIQWLTLYKTLSVCVYLVRRTIFPGWLLLLMLLPLLKILLLPIKLNNSWIIVKREEMTTKLWQHFWLRKSFQHQLLCLNKNLKKAFWYLLCVDFLD